MNQLELIGMWLVIIGLILFFIKKHWAQKGKIEAKGKTARCLEVVASIPIIGAFLMFTYVMTDTFLEWCLVNILFGSALGINFLVTWGLYNVQLPTKPMRLIESQVKITMKTDERIEIYEDGRDIERGREGIFMVCLSGKNRLSEIHYYTYFKGEIAKISEE